MFELYLLTFVVLLVRGGGAKNIEKKNKTDKIKPLKNEEKEKHSLKRKKFKPSHFTNSFYTL